MIKRLAKHGNSWAIVIDRGVMDLLKIEPESPVSITTDGTRLLIEPVRETGNDARFRAVMKKVHRRYSKAFRKLAE
ncbi:MAG: AbrB/MazE/SpoVT family DNA-binding domain-containing protein [Planctomycetes bacterium]|nr:AbrB/MazE/SpoVT family DNA-binding domain-containing protein [Planctomycetota bacterium]